MLYSLYSTYFAKDKPLRHYTQHLLVASLSYFLCVIFFQLEFNWTTGILFGIFTYLIDLDGVLYVLSHTRTIPEARQIIDAIKRKNIREASILATKHHKKFNMLPLHNIVVYVVVLVGCIISIRIHNSYSFAIFAAILSHFTFDILDDYLQLGHIHNWLWIFRRQKN